MATLNISPPDELKRLVDERNGVRELIREQCDVENVRTMLLDGFNAGPAQIAEWCGIAEGKAGS